MELVPEEFSAKFAIVIGAFRLSFDVNCLANSTDPNYSVTFAVYSIDSYGCHGARRDNLYQDGTPSTNSYRLTPNACGDSSPLELNPQAQGRRI